MSTIFSPILSEGQNQGQIFEQPRSTPVDNTTANTINAIGGLLKMGTESYTQQQHDLELKTLAGGFAKRRAAVRQGTMKPQEEETLNASDMSSFAARRPDLAAKGRELAIITTGSNPTEAEYKSMNHAKELEQTQQDTALSLQVQEAVKAGRAVIDPNTGQLDTYKTAENGAKVFQQDRALELMAKRNASLPSAAEREATTKKELFPHIEDIVNSDLNVGINLIQNLKVGSDGKYTPEQEKQVASVINERSIATKQKIAAAVIKAGGSPEVASYYQDRYGKSVDDLAKSFTGDYGSAKMAADNLAHFSNLKGMDVAKLNPLMTGYNKAFGSLLSAESLPGSARDELEDDNNIPEVTNNINVTPTPLKQVETSMNGLGNGKDFNSFEPKEQAYLFKKAEQVVPVGLKTFDTLPPEQRTTFANSLNVISKASLSPTEAGSQGFADYWNKNDIRQVIPKLAAQSGTAKVVETMSNDRMGYVEKTIKAAISSNPNLKYNPDTNTVEGNKLLTSLLQNIDTFYPYSSINTSGDIKAYKLKLFGQEEKPSPSSNE